MYSTNLLKHQISNAKRANSEIHSVLHNLDALVESIQVDDMSAVITEVQKLLRPLGLCVIHHHTLSDLKRIAANAESNDDEGLGATELVRIGERIDQSLRPGVAKALL